MQTLTLFLLTLGVAADSAFDFNNTATWRVRVVESDWTVAQYFAVNEVEFLTGTDCNSSTKVVVNAENAIESGSVWGLPGAFDGNTVFESRWNGRAATKWWENMRHPSLRYIGMTGLPSSLGCVRIYAPDVYMPANKDFTVAVERLDDVGQGGERWDLPHAERWMMWGPEWGSVHHKIFPNVWNEIKLAGPAHEFCGKNQHVVDGRCASCPASSPTNAAGDDTATLAVPVGRGAGNGTACDHVGVHSFEVGDGIHGAKLATKCQHVKQPRAMHSTSCGDDKVFVSFTTQTAFPGYRSCSLSNFFQTTTPTHCSEEPDETMPWRPKGCIFPEGGFQGHVALYQRNADGTMVELQRAHVPFCEEMGTVTANADCSVLAALCISRQTPDTVPNLKNDLLEENKIPCEAPQKSCTYPGGFYEDPVTINKPDWIDPTSHYFAGNYTGGAWFYDTRKAYLLEWRTGAVSPTPDGTALVNSAIGGARYASFELHLNADSSLYFLDLKSVIFGHPPGDENYHEGDSSLNVQRTADGGFRWYNDPLPASNELAPVGSGWGISCGCGHPTWTAVSYNPVLDQWGRWCWTDGNCGAGTGYPTGTSHSTFFRVAGEADRAEVYRNYESPNDINGDYGQPSDIASFGVRGWVGVLTGHVMGRPSGEGPITKIGMALLPASGAKGMIAANQSGGSNTAVKWLPEAYNLAEEGKGIGWAKLVHIGNYAEDDRFLLGYAVFSPKGPPNWKVWPEQFMLVEVTHDGQLLTEPTRVDNAGWSLQSSWTVLKNSGCVVWPNVWPDATHNLSRGPSNWYSEYGSWAEQGVREAGAMDTMYSSTLRIMSYCPDKVPTTGLVSPSSPGDDGLGCPDGMINPNSCECGTVTQIVEGCTQTLCKEDCGLGCPDGMINPNSCECGTVTQTVDGCTQTLCKEDCATSSASRAVSIVTVLLAVVTSILKDLGC